MGVLPFAQARGKKRHRNEASGRDAGTAFKA